MNAPVELLPLSFSVSSCRIVALGGVFFYLFLSRLIASFPCLRHDDLCVLLCIPFFLWVTDHTALRCELKFPLPSLLALSWISHTLIPDETSAPIIIFPLSVSYSILSPILPILVIVGHFGTLCLASLGILCALHVLSQAFLSLSFFYLRFQSEPWWCGGWLLVSL